MKPGYKMTDLGLLPDEWEVSPLGPLLLRKPDYGINAAAVKFNSQLPAYLRITDISEDGEYLKDGKASVDHPLVDNYFLRENDIVLARTGASTGKSYFYNPNDGRLVFAGFLIRVQANPQKLSPRFLKYYLQTAPFWNWVAITSMRSGQPGINGNEYSQLLLPLPSISEQQAIAEALSSIDDYLKMQRALLVKKRALKLATQQALLSGEERLTGFAGKWCEKTFGDVMTGFSSGATPFRGSKHFYNGPVKWVSSGELNYNVITDTIEHISYEAVKKTNLRLLPKGTFLMAITGLEAAGTRGSCAILGTEATTNQSCMALFPGKELLTDYLFHYYILHGDSLAFQYCQGTKQQSYTGEIVKRLPILLPPIDEQHAIVRVLNDMDAEIAKLAAQVDKTQALKQGMMQNLLTGSVRLVANKSSTLLDA